jgi:hypothetical protein
LLYLIIFILLAVIGILDFIKVDRLLKRALYILILGGFILLGGIRWKTGTDWNSYHYFFATGYSWESFNVYAFETGYTILNFLVKQLTDSYTVFLFCLSFLVIGVKGIAFTKYTNSLLILSLAYFCFFLGDIFSVRQQVAVSLCFVGVIFIMNKKPILFISTILLAFQFHNSVLIFLLAYWIFNLNLSNNWLLSIILVAILLGFSGVFEPILKLFNLLLGSIDGTSASRISDKVSYYAENKDLSDNMGKGTTLLIGVIRRCVFIPIYLYFRKKCEAKNPHYKGFLNLFIFGNVIYFIFATTLLVMVRATIYFIAFEMIMLVILLESIESKRLKFLLYLIVVLYCGLKLYINLSSYWDLFIPYNTIFDENITRTLH